MIEKLVRAERYLAEAMRVRRLMRFVRDPEIQRQLAGIVETYEALAIRARKVDPSAG